MTFIVNNDGDVYQKVSWQGTRDIASRMTWYNPDSSWKKVVDTEIKK